MPLNCLGAIRSSYHKFSEKEKKIADYILEKPEMVIHRTINEVAEDLNIADATVFRFSKHIGFKGFQAMKIALASEVTAPTPEETTTMVDSEKDFTETIFKSNIRSLQNTMKMIDSTSIKQAIDFILQAKRIEFYGTGDSSVIAMNACQKFVSSGLRAFAFIEPHYQLRSASGLSNEDLAVFISHSGSNKETINILKAAKDTGTKTIGITSNGKSTISLNVDVSLFTDSEESEYHSAPFFSQISQICLIDALCLTIANLKQNGHKTEQNSLKND